MRYRYLSAPAVILLSASLLAQVPGETPAPPQAPGADKPSIVVGPQNLTGTVPAAFRTVFGNSNNVIPISWTPTRYHQVFVGSELPKALVIRGLGLRLDERFNNRKGQTIDMEITLAYTKKTPATLSTTFASNFDVTTPKPIIVFPRAKFTLPDGPTTNPTNPQFWHVQIPFKIPYVWTQVANRNMLVQIRVYGNTAGNRSFSYILDAASGSTVTTSRVWSSSPTSTTGSLGRNFGLVMSFLDKVKAPASYTTFGKGCPGTGGSPGVVLPSAYLTKMGNSNNWFGVGQSNQRYQQVFAGAQVGKGRPFVGHSLRMRNATYSSGSQTLEIKVSTTTKTPATLTSTFASNITSAQTVVFKKKIYNYPSFTPNTDPTKFKINFKWDKIFVWIAPKGQSLLMEIINSSTASHRYFVDAASGDTNVARVWGTGPTATTGTKGSNFGLIMKLDFLGAGNAVPILANTGMPILGKTFAITLASAKANTAAALIFGGSNTKWGTTNLPLDLTALSARGCFLLVSPDVFTGVGVGANGTGTININVPNSSALVGVQWHNQFLVIDAAANGLGMAFSNGGTGKVGEQ